MTRNQTNRTTFGRLLLVLVLYLCNISSLTAQGALDTFKANLSQLKVVGYQDKAFRFYQNSSPKEQNAMRSYLVSAITDSLKAEKKDIAMDYIDLYKQIALADDEYLSPLVMTQAKVYYDRMDARGIEKLVSFMTSTAEMSSLDYSSELAELTQMKDEVLHGCDEMLGYWVADITEMRSADPFYLNIYVDDKGEYHVKTEYTEQVTAAYTDLWKYENEDAKYSKTGHFAFLEEQHSSECVLTSPSTLSYFWSSEKLNVGKEELAAVLRSGVRSVSNSIIGEMARSNSHSFGTSFMGSTGAIVGEILLNSIIDNLTISKKTIKTITGNLSSIDRNNLNANINVDCYILNSEDGSMKEDHCQFSVNLIRCQWDKAYVKENIAFADLRKSLRQNIPMDKKQRKIFYKNNREAKSLVRKMGYVPYSFITNNTLRRYNKEQIQKLKEYNKTH